MLQGTLRFTAVDLLADVSSYGEPGVISSTSSTISSVLVPSTDTVPARLPHALRHDLESLLWVAEYALYRRALETTKALPPTDATRTAIENAIEGTFGAVDAHDILCARDTMLASAHIGVTSLRARGRPFSAVLCQIERPLRNVHVVLITLLAQQNREAVAQRTEDADQFCRVMGMPCANTFEEQTVPLTCALVGERLTSCLRVGSSVGMVVGRQCGPEWPQAGRPLPS